MPYFLAIDAGGTSTRALLADDTRILARASTGSVKLMRVPVAEATNRLAALLQDVSASAGVPLTQIARTCCGLAGATIPAVRTWATRLISTTASGELLLVGDEEIALEAAFSGAPGILLIAGTGSNVICRAPDGTLHGAGGWGPILGDEGAGYWIGLEAVRAALRAHDARPDDAAPTLLRAIQLHWKLASLPELIELGNRRGDANHPAPDFASLSPVVASCAAEGNSIAAGVLHRSGELLAHLIEVVVNKVADAGSTVAVSQWVNGTIPVAFTGSVLGQIPAVREVMTSTLARTLPAARLSEMPVDPLVGALYRARHG
jgi:glucosamine kinase